MKNLTTYISLALAALIPLASTITVRAEDGAVETEKSEVKTSAGDGAGKSAYKDEAVRHYNRGHDLHKQGFYNQAVAEYKSALAADDRMEEAHTNLGLIYAGQKNYTKAMEAFRKSLALNPKRTNALNGLGTVLYARNKASEAMEQWKKAVEIDPNFASAYFNIGNAFENEKDYKSAVEAYASAITVSPNLADAYFRIGTIYARQKHAAQSKLLLNKAIALQPDGDFVREAKKTIASIESEFSTGQSDEPEVKMNIIAPPGASGS